MRSSAEIAREEKEAEIRRLHERRFRAFVQGLESLDTLGVSDDLDRMASKEEYVQNCQDELRQLLARAEAAKAASGRK